MNKVNILKLTDSSFPEALINIPLAPKQLFYIGDHPDNWLHQPKVAIVGSRKISSYGREVTNRLAGELASYGIIIISGLALGVDGQAHQAALEAGGVTVAVLPTPVERIYPASHANLAQQLIDNGGTILSEYARNDPIYKVNFTNRNRLISGLADIVIITEAAARSGSLNTARFALEQGKTVMAVPGNIDALYSEGTYQLIKAGAIPVTSVSDVLFTLGINPKISARPKVFRGTAQEQTVLQLIIEGISDQEVLAQQTQLDGAAIAGILIGLELAGQIKPVGGGQWIKS